MLLKKKSTQILGFLVFIAVLIILAANTTLAQTTTPPDFKPIGAGLAVGLAGIGSGIGMGIASSSAIGAITEKPEVFGKAFLFIVLIEAVAIYGLLISILLIF